MLEKQKAKKGLKFISRFFSLLCVFAFLQGFFTNPLFAEDYYWENPETISSNDSRFPTVATNSNGLSAVIWQEVTAKDAFFIIIHEVYNISIDFTPKNMI